MLVGKVSGQLRLEGKVSKVFMFNFHLRCFFLIFRASRPLLTIYISPDWHQSGTGMREYHAMFLEQLTVKDLKRKLARKCGLEETEIIAILK